MTKPEVRICFQQGGPTNAWGYVVEVTGPMHDWNELCFYRGKASADEAKNMIEALIEQAVAFGRQEQATQFRDDGS